MSSTNIKQLHCFLWLPSFYDFFQADHDNVLPELVQKIKNSTAWAVREKAAKVFLSQQQQNKLAIEGSSYREIYQYILLFIDEHLSGNCTMITDTKHENCYYQWQDSVSKEINGTGLEDFAEDFLQKKHTCENSILILFGDLPIGSCKAEQQYCCVLKDKKPHEYNSLAVPAFIKIPLLNGAIKDVSDWLIEHRTKRVFNDSTETLKRHKLSTVVGKTGKKNHFVYKPVDKERVENLLNTAIGQPNTTDGSTNKSILFNWDKDADGGHYIVFEDEVSLQNYHAYHLIATNLEDIKKEKPSFTEEIWELLEYRKQNP